MSGPLRRGARALRDRDAALLLVAHCCRFAEFADLRPLLRAGLAVWVLRDLGMIRTSCAPALRGAVTAASPAGQAGWGCGGPGFRIGRGRPCGCTLCAAQKSSRFCGAAAKLASIRNDLSLGPAAASGPPDFGGAAMTGWPNSAPRSRDRVLTQRRRSSVTSGSRPPHSSLAKMPASVLAGVSMMRSKISSARSSSDNASAMIG